jgi:hypothetical protein
MHLPVRPFPWSMPYGRTTHEPRPSGCSGSDSGEDNHFDCRSHHQDQVEPVSSGAERQSSPQILSLYITEARVF